jgi:O-antigen/teichoic acid export membrane protein
MAARSSVFSALRWTTASTMGKTALQFLQVVVLARLLTPADFGLMAIVLTVVVFLQGISDIGLGNAVIHHADASHEELSSLYWMSLLVGAVLSLVVGLLSPLVADFYKEPRLQQLLTWSGLSLVIAAIGQQLKARAERDLAFDRLAMVELSSSVLGFAVAAITAWLMRDVLALVLGLLAGSVSMSLLSWALLARGWRPAIGYRWAHVRRFVHFGSYATLSNLVGTINSQADVAIGGRLFGHVELGTYSMARDLSLRLSSLVNPIVTRVGFPVMAQDHANKRFVASVYGQTISAIAALNFPLYLGVLAFAPDLIQFLFGSKWIESAALLRVLALWGMIRSLMNPVGSLLYACGKARAAFRWNLSLVFLTVPAFVIGAHAGALGLALAQLAVMLLVFGPCWRYLIYPDTGMTWQRYAALFVRPLVISGVAVGLAFALVAPVALSPALSLLAALLVGAGGYAALSWRFNRAWVSMMFRMVGRS